MAEQTDLRGSPSARTGRTQLAQALALVALLAALVGALGPADKVRTTYSWPPATLPEGSPASTWYTPLLLVRHRAETIEASLPCTLPPALPEAARPVTVLATARVPERTGALAVTREGSRLLVRVGREVLTGVELRASSAVANDCAYALRLAGTRWSLEGGPDEEALAGELERVPVVSGVFSALDLRQGTPPSVRLTTFPHASRPTLLQKLAWTLALLCVAAALLLVSLEARPRPWAATRRLARGAVAHAHPADAVVGVVLLGWWVLAPVFHDDGWIATKHGMFSESGGFTTYYAFFGGNSPLGYWMDWAQQWVAQASDALVFLRVPALLCLAVVWVLCRWSLTRVVASPASRSTLPLWALASTFLIGALAWGMTLRPEPTTALFVTAALACAVRFLERETAAPLAVAAVVVPFAVTTHPAGIVSLAPLLLIAPRLLSWTRHSLGVVATLIASSFALLAVLLFVGADIDQRRADAQQIAAAGNATQPWTEELVRYSLLTDFPPLRRGSVALMALAVLAFVLRPRRVRDRLLDLPTATLGLGLLLFVTTPSKLPWHFGALIGVAAVAVAAETARVWSEAGRARRWTAWPVAAVVVATVAIAWSWAARRSWGVDELRTLDWTPGFVSVERLVIALPLLLLGGAVVLARVRGRRDRLPETPWRVAAWTAPMLVAPLIAFTVGLLVVDTAKTSSWALGRQNLGALTGEVDCGRADGLLVAVPDTARPLAQADASVVPNVPAGVPAAPVAGLQRFALGPVGERSTARSPWFRLPTEGRVGLFVSGRPASSDRLELEWGRLERGRIRSLGTDEVPRGLASEAGAMLPWWFVAAGELPPPEPGANVVRMTLRSDVARGAAVAVTAPVTYANERLRPRLDQSASPSLVFTDLLMSFPCVRTPRLSGGIVEVPRHILVSRTWPSPLQDPVASPFARLLDLYPLQRLPLADSSRPPGSFVVFAVDQRIPGAVQAPALATTFES